MGFKGKQVPSITVKKSSKMPCLFFEPKRKRRLKKR
jgi:hypothetical protein